MSHTNLSLILSGKRPISTKTGQLITELLELNLERNRENGLAKEALNSEATEEPVFDQISQDHHALRTEWHHAAILSLLETKRHGLSPKSMGRLLRVQEIHVRIALERLKRLGLITRQSGRWTRSKFTRQMESGLPAMFSRKFHQRLLEKAKYTLENTAEKQFHFTSTTLALDPVLLPVLIKAIEHFVRRIQKGVSGKKNPSEVYALNLQCFPLTEND